MVPLLFSLEAAASGSDPSDPRTVSSLPQSILMSFGPEKTAEFLDRVASSLPDGALTCICGCYGETMIPCHGPVPH